MQPVELELQEIAGESIGWIPLEDRAYLHLGDAKVVVVTGMRGAELADRTFQRNPADGLTA